MPPTLLTRLTNAATRLTSPLLPDDYLALVNPLWSGTELCGRIVAVRRETADSASLLIRPGRGWPGHTPGQYVRLGVDIDGIRYQRSFTLSDAPRRDGLLRITVKAGPDGRVSRHLVHGDVTGAVVRLAPPGGDFVLPPDPGKLLFITAGSGITPAVAMLRAACQNRDAPDAVVVHSARYAGDVILGGELRALHLRHPSVHLHEWHTDRRPRLDLAADLAGLCPDWADRDAYVCGPAALLDAATAHWARTPRRLHIERFAPPAPPAGVGGAGGTVRFTSGGVRVPAPGDRPLLEVGEEAGVLMPSGCRMGICFSCVCPLKSGQVRDLRTGAVHGEEGDLVQTCVSAAAGPVELDI